MSDLIISMAEQGSAEWLAERLGKVTASKAGDLVTPEGKQRTGKTPESYAMELAAELVYRRTVAPFAGSKATDHGHECEPKARRAYEALTGVDVEQVGFASRGEMGASLDGAVGTDGTIEIKAPLPIMAMRARAYAREHGKPLPEYLPQVHFGLLVMDRQWCDHVLYPDHDDLKLSVTRVERSAEWDEALSKAAAWCLALRDRLVADERRAA